MCGISAIYRFTEISDADIINLHKMNHEMAYRGPDGEGYWNDETCALAHKRLSIIGLQNGSQPLSNPEGSLKLICNGEIYNYKQLKQELSARGYSFKTDSDCEPILYLYELYGTDCLQYIRGMFAFCLYDIKNKRLFVARDRVGEKFLYYSQLKTGFVFSTELKTILKYYIDCPQINGHALAEAIRFNYPIEPQQTFIEQIKRVRAGEYLVIDEHGLQRHTYWTHKHTPIFEGSAEEAKSEVLRLLRESVTNCLQSDVPVAVLLSGGVDSSAIAAMAKESREEIHVISAGYEGRPAQDEREIAKQFAKENKLVFHEIELSETDFSSFFEEYIQFIDEPISDVSAMSQFALYKKAKELGFTVLLSGIGGDELFYGYPYYNRLSESIRLHRDHMSLFPWKNKKLDYLNYFIRNWKNILYAGYPTVKLDDAPPVAWTYEDYCQFAQSASIEVHGDTISFGDLDVHYSFSSNSDLDAIYDFVFTKFMCHLSLYLSDRLGMANSVEIRSPLLDYKLVDFVSSLPPDIKFTNGTPKEFFKKCLTGIVPDWILNGTKKGFEPPWAFIKEMCAKYNYSTINADHVFYNSMLADKLLTKLF